jgi:hypothetical protein
MITWFWTNEVVRVVTDHGAFVDLNFEFLLVLNYDDVTWD